MQKLLSDLRAARHQLNSTLQIRQYYELNQVVLVHIRQLKYPSYAPSLNHQYPTYMMCIAAPRTTKPHPTAAPEITEMPPARTTSGKI